MAARFPLVMCAAVLAVAVAWAPQAVPPLAALQQTRPTEQRPPDTQQQQSAQQQPPPPQQPVFRAGVNFVRVDVIVSDRQGNPVADLAQADFEVSEDGKPQKIETFKFIKVEAPESKGEPVRAIHSVDDEEFEAGRDDVRLVAIFLDDYHVRRGSSMVVRTPLSSFIAKQLAPADMVAIMYPLTPTSDLRFTRNHDAIIKAIEKFEGRKYDYRPLNNFEERYAYYPASVVERIRNEVTFTALRGLATHMGSVREGRKAMILVSEGYTNILPAQLNDPVAAMPGLGNPARGQVRTGEPSQAEEWAAFTANVDLQQELREIYDTANRNNTAIYALDPRGLAVFEFDINEGVGLRDDRKMLDSTIDTLHVLANNTDGRAIVNRNDLEAGLKQVVKDSSAYYLIGYNSTQAPADGKFHEIKVRVRRPGIQLRARKGYWAPTAEDIVKATSPPAPELPSGVKKALSAIVEPPRGRLIRSWVGTSRGENGRTRVTFVWEPSPPPPGVERSAASSIMLQAAGTNPRPYFRGRVPDVLISDAAVPIDPLKGPFRASFEAPPGPIQIKIAVEGEDGRVLDTETRDLYVPDMTAPQVYLTTPAVTRAANARAFRLLAADPNAMPTASREFRRTERLLIRFEAFGPGGTVPEVGAKLLNRLGAAMVAVAVKSPATPGAPFEIDMPLAGLASGEYILEITARGETGEASEMVPLRIVA